jgi:transcriptional regulator with XRE-family HTH domain
MDELTRNFATNLRAVRVQQEMTQQGLAKRADLSVAYVSLLERGQRSPPLPTVVEVAKALRVKPVYLLQELDIPEPSQNRRSREPARGR